MPEKPLPPSIQFTELLKVIALILVFAVIGVTMAIIASHTR